MKVSAYSGNLEIIEQELIMLLSSDLKTWTGSYLLMKRVEEDRLYHQKGFTSFTAWLHSMEEKTDVKLAQLWKRKKAGKFYEKYWISKNKEGMVLPKIQEITASPDNLVLIEKITEEDPTLTDQLMEKALHMEVTRQELKNTWTVVRTQRVERGEVPARKNQHHYIGITPRIEEMISRTKIILALQTDLSWLAKRVRRDARYRFFLDVKVEGQLIPIVLAEMVTEKEVILHGISTSIKDCETCRDYVDYFWLINVEEEKVGTLEIIRKGQEFQCQLVKRPEKLQALKRFLCMKKLFEKIL